MAAYSLVREFTNEIAAAWHKRQHENLTMPMNAVLVPRSLTLAVWRNAFRFLDSISLL